MFSQVRACAISKISFKYSTTCNYKQIEKRLQYCRSPDEISDATTCLHFSKSIVVSINVILSNTYICYGLVILKRDK